MFSHYADGHQGFCLGFSTSQAEDFPFFHRGRQRVTMEVKYPKKFEPPSFFSEPDTNWVRWNLLTKSPQWAYEQEFRVLNDGGSVSVAFQPGMLKEIILGCCMEKNDQDKVLSLTKNWPTPVSLLKAKKKYDAFALRLEPFTP